MFSIAPKLMAVLTALTLCSTASAKWYEQLPKDATNIEEKIKIYPMASVQPSNSDFRPGERTNLRRQYDHNAVVSDGFAALRKVSFEDSKGQPKVIFILETVGFWLTGSGDTLNTRYDVLSSFEVMDPADGKGGLLDRRVRAWKSDRFSLKEGTIEVKSKSQVRDFVSRSGLSMPLDEFVQAYGLSPKPITVKDFIVKAINTPSPGADLVEQMNLGTLSEKRFKLRAVTTGFSGTTPKENIIGLHTSGIFKSWFLDYAKDNAISTDWASHPIRGESKKLSINVNSTGSIVNGSFSITDNKGTTKYTVRPAAAAATSTCGDFFKPQRLPPIDSRIY